MRTLKLGDFDGEGVDWTSHSEDEQENYALMALRSSGLRQKDCDFHEKRMAKQAELNNRMSKGSGQRKIRPVWNNVQRVNHQNQFVPKAVLTRTGKIQVNTTRTSGTNIVNTARTSGTNTINTARHNFNKQAVPTNAARKVNTIKPIVNNARPKAGFHKTLSPFIKPFNRTTSLRTNFSLAKSYTAEVIWTKRNTVMPELHNKMELMKWNERTDLIEAAELC
ncbi:hypothetical protein Tco_0441322 [Tanacetum coccineum]